MISLHDITHALPHSHITHAEQFAAHERWSITTDSRSTPGSSAIFVALRGARFDGHDFLADAHEKGVSAVIIEDEASVSDLNFELVIQVPDTRLALQQLAAHWRAQQPAHVIAVTGSLGKTIVKELLSAILSQTYTVYRSPGSYNSQIGVPLALLGIEPSHQIAIIEAGISQPGEMRRHQAMIKPDLGVLTGISLAHPVGLPTEDITLREKMKLFSDIHAPDTLVLPTHISEQLGLTPQEPQPRILEPRYQASSGWRFMLDLPHLERPLEACLKAPGEHMLAHALTAVRAALRMGSSAQDIIAGLASYRPAAMRLEVHTTPDGITLLNDAYSADPTSMRAAILALVQHGGAQRKTAILGDMEGLGEMAQRAHIELGAWLATTSVDRLITVGKQAAWIAQGAQESLDMMQCRDLDELDERVRQGLFEQGDVILFKASRALGLERVARRYLESIGPTRLIVDLGALRDNFHALRAHVGTHTKIMAVVKSFGYGNDATRVSMTLIREGVHALSVAYADEAIPLRKAGVTLPILINNTLMEDLEKIVKYDLTALIYSTDIARHLQDISQAHHTTTRVHIKIDTGMHRVGLKLDALDPFLDTLSDCPNLFVTGTMTHLAAADEAQHDAFTREQLARFERAITHMSTREIKPGTRHAANTSAAWRFPSARYDMVRVGLGLYGLDPGDDVTPAHAPLRKALRWTTRITHIHSICAGETIGYGRAHTAPHTQTIATLAVGYADGFPRAMSNGGEVLVHGVRCKVVGRVCMDVCMIDVTHLTHVVMGDEAVLFGAQHDAYIHVEELAARASTISYEILCNISPRVRRIFFQG